MSGASDDFPLRRRRRQLAKAALLIHLAQTADRWAREVVDEEPGLRPFAEWREDDPRGAILDGLDLEPTDLARVLRALAEELEARAERAGVETALAYFDL